MKFKHSENNFQTQFIPKIELCDERFQIMNIIGHCLLIRKKILIKFIILYIKYTKIINLTRIKI